MHPHTRYHDAHKYTSIHRYHAHAHTCFQLAFTSIHSNHTLRHAPTLQDTTTHTNASSSRSRQFTVTIPCVMHPHYKIHDAHTCFQLAFTSIHSNHTLRHAPTLQDTTTHTNASSSRSRQFTVTIPCVMHPHYKIPRRTEMLPARVHVNSQHTHAFQLAFTSIHSNHTLRHAPTLQDITTHTNASSSRSRRFTVTIPCVMELEACVCVCGIL